MGGEGHKIFIKLRVESFQIVDLTGERGGVTGAKHKLHLCPPQASETKTRLQRGHKEVVTGNRELKGGNRWSCNF